MKETKFELKINPLYFTPNIADRFGDDKKVHVIKYGKCNFRCDFCPFHSTKYVDNSYKEYTLDSFEEEMWNLLKYSQNFKFTGGEPTLNPFLPDLMRILKIYNAKIFLDTNGSYPQKVKNLIDQNLVDIVGISLKGITSEEALDTSKIKNAALCWKNVWETIDYVSKRLDVTLIITYVACDGMFNQSTLDCLAELLKPYPNVVLKINNCYLQEYLEEKKGLSKNKIYKMLEKFVDEHPDYKDRTVLFSDHSACLEKAKIHFF